MDKTKVAKLVKEKNENYHKKRWHGLIFICLATLMIVLDTTIVNVALPSIRSDLGFNDASLAWIVNIYLLTFGGFLLLSGRLGDMYGQRIVFLSGITLFSLASLMCGLATVQGMLIVGRSLQGIGGAVVTATALSLIINLFSTPTERARAIGAYSFVCAGGGSIGVLLGGILIYVYDWHSIFLVNLPIGLIVLACSWKLLPPTRTAKDSSLDYWGAITIIAALMLAVYAIMNITNKGWVSLYTLGLLTVAALIFTAFLLIESKVKQPLVPLGLFNLHNLATANVIGVLWASSMFAWFFLCALYLQQVLNYSVLEVGLAFLPANLIMAFCSLSVSSRLIIRYGLKVPLVVGLTLASAGLLLLARAPSAGAFIVDVLPGMLLLGFGAGMAFNPVLLAAMNDVPSSDSGLASGIVNTSFMMGGALGLSIISNLASSYSKHLAIQGKSTVEAISGGYNAAFLLGALMAALAALISFLFLRKDHQAKSM